MTTVFLTKHALTEGIKQADGCDVHVDGYATRNSAHCGSPDYVFAKVGVDAFLNRAKAEAHVRVMIDRKIKSLQKQMIKLQQLKVQYAQGETTETK